MQIVSFAFNIFLETAIIFESQELSRPIHNFQLRLKPQIVVIWYAGEGYGQICIIHLSGNSVQDMF